MGQDMINETLKQELKKAIALGNKEEIEKITKLLNIPPEQTKYFDKGLTGYPSTDEIWVKYYDDNAGENAINIPKNKTVWDAVEEKLMEYYDIPAIEYFGNVFSREDFKELVYTWARTFRAMGVEENEIVPIYGPFSPDIAAMFFALIAIGATPYFLKLAITPKALEEETRESKVAVVFDGMWSNVAHEFTKDKYKSVIISSVSANMPSPKKEIVSFITKLQAIKQKSRIPNEKKYIWIDKAREISNYYTGEVKVPFKANRNAVITSSSGTTVGGVVKGTVATNESVLSQVWSTSNSKIPYEPGDRTLNHFPPTASTSLNSLFLVGLVRGATIIMDPRVSENDFYNQLTTLKPNMCINTSSLWEAFFNRVAREIKQGKKFDFSYAKGWMLGGEGSDNKKIEKWDSIMRGAHAKSRIYGGYGLSEVFSGVCIDRADKERDYTGVVAAVGTPQAGMTVGVFDGDKEVSYNERGELRVKTNAQMKEYYGKRELTDQTIKDGWVRTGDLAHIDENGFVYIWGRLKDAIYVNNEKLHLFDVANEIKKNDFIMDAVVLSMPTENNENSLVAHIVWSENVIDEEKKSYIEMMNSQMSKYLPQGVELIAYSSHEQALPYSPTTLKTDKNKMSSQTNGYIQCIDEELYDVEFKMDSNGRYIADYSEQVKSKKK